MLRFDIPPVFSHVVRWEAFIVFSLCLLALLVNVEDTRHRTCRHLT